MILFSTFVLYAYIESNSRVAHFGREPKIDNFLIMRILVHATGLEISFFDKTLFFREKIIPFFAVHYLGLKKNPLKQKSIVYKKKRETFDPNFT